MQQAASHPSTSLSSGSRRMGSAEWIAWVVLAIAALVYYNMWRSDRGMAHVEFMTTAANVLAVKGALITSALAAGLVMRRNPTWGRAALFWTLTLMAGIVLIVFACVELFDEGPVDAQQATALSIAPRESIVVYSTRSKGRQEFIVVRRERALLPGVVWTQGVYRSPRPAPMLPTVRCDEGGNLHLAFPPVPDAKKYLYYPSDFYMTGEETVFLR